MSCKKLISKYRDSLIIQLELISRIPRDMTAIIKPCSYLVLERHSSRVPIKTCFQVRGLPPPSAVT